jgi:hypothetical protein
LVGSAVTSMTGFSHIHVSITCMHYMYLSYVFIS